MKTDCKIRQGHADFVPQPRKYFFRDHHPVYAFKGSAPPDFRRHKKRAPFIGAHHVGINS
jgi:hypothetical protein